MTDYRTLSDWAKAKIDKKLMEDIEPHHHRNESNGFEWDEPEYTIAAIHTGHYCASCWMVSYNCLCSHD